MSEVKKINVVRLTAVHYQHPHLQEAARFLEDFGLVPVQKGGSYMYFRGFGVDPYIYIAENSPLPKRTFIRGIWTVASFKDLQAAAAHPAATGPIEEDVGPGGGKTVSLTDPNGFSVTFIHGQELRAKDGANAIVSRSVNNTGITPNLAFEKHRQGQSRRFNQGPSPVHRLGHYGFGMPASRFEEVVSWYTSLMNLKLTDAIFQPANGKDIMKFFHIDLGSEFVDHHVCRMIFTIVDAIMNC